jgi:hypothetical protein
MKLLREMWDFDFCLSIGIAIAISGLMAFAAYAQDATQPAIILTWDHPAPETVTHYWVERSLRVDFQDFARLGPVDATTYTDHPTSVVRTYYRVRAEGPGGLSEPSDYVQVVPVFPPVAPQNLRVEEQHGD